MTAWLNATPKPDDRTKRAKVAAGKPKLSRLEEMKKKRIKPQMPPNPLPHMFNWLVEIGMTEVAGDGLAPLKWRELDAWCVGTGVNLDPWERRLLRRCSEAYIAEARRAESENCPPPWHAPVSRREISIEKLALDHLLG